MRNLVLAALLSTVFVAAPAQARNGDFYLGADFGVMLAQDADLSFIPGAGAGTNGTVTLDHDRGFDGGVYAGYDLGPVRIEAEASYRSADLDTINSNFTAGSVVIAGARPAGGGDVSALSFMGNAMLDLGNEDGLSFFIGGGAGYAKVSYGNVRTFANGATMLDDNDWRFAWQGLAGVRQAVSDNVDLTVRYRYFNAGNVQVTGFGGRAVEGDFRSHALMGGVTFNF